MNITVFGGTQPNPADYEAALRLGRLLAESGHTVLTGGYMGTMEAVSRGAAEAGGHVIGVTCEEIERWRGGGANPWVLEEVHLPTLRERLFALIDRADAYIALPGGTGTLTEICMVWNQLVIESLPPRPLILVGEGWRKAFETLLSAQDGYIPAHQRRWLSFAKDVEEAAGQLRQPAA
ncbi:MAG TPA: LOG family protein [Chloroflexi bacterium]|nr:LOG family protein [Chloroflexota bacterium]HPO58348.1 LOG family protein [Anaerolineaceae bacterium]